MTRAVPLLALMSGTLAAIPGCIVHDVDTDPKPPVDLPPGYAAAVEQAAEHQTPDRWWTAFGDPQLDALVREVLEQNLQLRAAWARIEQARAIVKQSGAGHLPQIDANVSAGYRRQFISFDLPTGNTLDNANYDLSVSIGYEVDLWGRVEASKRAADLQLKASRQDLDAMALSFTGTIAELWFQIAEAKALIALLNDQLDANLQSLELLELRFQKGFTRLVDVYQQRQRVAATRSQIPLQEARLRVLQHQLAVLAGRAPRDVHDVASLKMPEPPDLPDVGVPGNLLERRPDVQAAKLRLIAADYRVASAFADRLPRLQLSASVGFQSANLLELFQNFVFSIVGQLTAPLFDGFRREAVVEQNEAVVKELVASYGQTLLSAVQEVEDALVQEQKQREYITRLEEQIDLGRRTLTETRARYANGLTDYLPVLSALITLQNLEQSLVSAKRQLLSYRITLYQALGGTWMSELEPPPAPDEEADGDDQADPEPAAAEPAEEESK